MSRTRLAAVLVCVAVGAAGLVPAGAAPAAPNVDRLDPQRGMHSIVSELLATPHPDRLADLRGALERTREGTSSTAVVAEGPGAWAQIGAAGDVDGDRRPDVVVQRPGTTEVRSGKDGRVLLSRGEVSLLPVSGAGGVRLLELDYGFQDSPRGLVVELLVSGLDRTGEAVWERAYSGTVQFLGAGPMYVLRIEDMPVVLDARQLDPEGRPALMLGSYSATLVRATAVSSFSPTLLTAADGSVTTLPVVRGAGAGTAWAFPLGAAGDARTCYATSAPVGPLSRVTLSCDGSQRWAATVRVRDPYVELAGDFDGDDLPDVLAASYGWERPRPREVLRGSRVLSFGDGSEVATSRVDGLYPMGRDISGDGQPDFLEIAFAGADVAIQAVTLAGEPLWRRPVAVGDSPYLSAMIGPDITGDGLADGLVHAEAEKGPSTSVVVDGRTGRAMVRQGVDALMVPGLRSRGADLAVLEARAGRARVLVLSGDSGAALADVTVPGPTGVVSPGSAGAVDVDGDGRRDLVVTSHTGDHQVTTAFSAGSGRVLWQQREKLVATVVMVELVAEACC